MAGKAFDIRLIPEFQGVSSDHTVSKWLEQVELVCEMCGVDNIERVLPLRLIVWFGLLGFMAYQPL